MQLNLALRVRNTKNRNRLRLLDKRGGFSEDRSKRLDLDHSKLKYSEATLEVFRVRIGGYALDVNNHLMENTEKMNFSFKIMGWLQNAMFRLLRSKLFVKTFKDSL